VVSRNVLTTVFFLIVSLEYLLISLAGISGARSASNMFALPIEVQVFVNTFKVLE